MSRGRCAGAVPIIYGKLVAFCFAPIYFVWWHKTVNLTQPIAAVRDCGGREVRATAGTSPPHKYAGMLERPCTLVADPAAAGRND